MPSLPQTHEPLAMQSPALKLLKAVPFQPLGAEPSPIHEFRQTAARIGQFEPGVIYRSRLESALPIPLQIE